MRTYKLLIVVILLIITISLSHSLPKTKYIGTGFISNLNLPISISGWEGRDVSREVGLNVNSSTYNFVSEALAYDYVNKEGRNLLFIILDAGNFHHPKVCFTGAGFKIKELPDSMFQLSRYTLKTHTLFTKRGRDSFLSFYWIVIDKHVAHEWIEQKLKQLIFSLFGTKRVGLMVRIDIPAKEDDINEATILADQFISDIIKTLSSEQVSYLFGSK